MTTNQDTGKKVIHIQYSEFYMAYWIWSDLTEDEMLSIDGVKSCHKCGSEQTEVTIEPRYSDKIVLSNIEQLAINKDNTVE